MKLLRTYISISILLFSLPIIAQVEEAGTVRKRSVDEKNTKSNVINLRQQNSLEQTSTHDADLEYMKQVYRKLDLEKGPNAALYYPEDVIDGQENLFRIILNNVLGGKLPAYEYLDGKEIFTEQYKVDIPALIQRFDIYAKEAKGSNEKNLKFEIDEADVPVNNVTDYYIIERWEFDRRSNSMKTIVEAICPVLSRYNDFGSDARYPMFWIKMNDLRPYLTGHYVFVSDDNNLPAYSLDDYFTLGLYEGEIYKTRNMRNLSLAQMFPDEDDLKRAQDSIDNRLRTYGKDRFVPTREEYLSMKEKQDKENSKSGETIATSDELPVREMTDNVDSENSEEKATPAPSATTARAKKKNSSKKTKTVTRSSSSAAEKSVRRRKK